MSTTTTTRGILSPDNSEQRESVIQMLTRAYWMEIETVMSYLAASINLDGIRAQTVAASLIAEVEDELGHARQFARRIKELYGVVPGSAQFTPEQSYLQPPKFSGDVEHVVKGVIEAESGAIEHYNAIIEATEQIDPVTQDMVIAILHDEERHLRLVEGFEVEFTAAEDR